jgi:hypothetical protein
MQNSETKILSLVKPRRKKQRTAARDKETWGHLVPQVGMFTCITNICQSWFVHGTLVCVLRECMDGRSACNKAQNAISGRPSSVAESVFIWLQKIK